MLSFTKRFLNLIHCVSDNSNQDTGEGTKQLNDGIARSWKYRSPYKGIGDTIVQLLGQVCSGLIGDGPGLKWYLGKDSQMKTIRIVTVALLMTASAWALHVVLSGQPVNTPSNKNREEQFDMTNEKVIMLIEAKIQPQHRAELVEAAHEYLPLVRAEAGVEAFYVAARKDDPNTFVFYEVYRSQAAQDFHLQQDFTKKFLATLKGAQVGDRVRTNLVELGLEEQTHSN